MSDISRLVVERQRQLPEGMDYREDHLAAAALTAPQYMSSVISYAYGDQSKDGGLLSMLTEGIGNVEYSTSGEYEWNLYTTSQPLREVVELYAGNSATPGKGGTPFKVVLEDELFNPTDILVTDSGMQVYVMSKRSAGMGVEYTMRINGGAPTDFVDPDDIKVGAKFVKDYSAVAEGSHKGGGSAFDLPLKLKNRTTTLRKSYSITRSAATTAMVIKIKNPDNPNEETNLWVREAEWKHLMSWGQEIEKMLMYGKYSDLQRGYFEGPEGRQVPVYQGAGLREQISPANQRSYTHLTYDQLDDFLLDLSFSSSKYGGARDFLAVTGQMGMRELERAIQEYTSKNNIQVTDAGTFITGSGSELTLTGHFKRIEFINDISLTFKRMALYDDTERNRKKHPVSGKPLESYRITILSTKTYDGKPNIMKVSKQGSENLMWYNAGSIYPNSPLTGAGDTGMRSSSGGFDGYTVHYLTETSLKLNDPTCCGELIHALQS